MARTIQTTVHKGRRKERLEKEVLRVAAYCRVSTAMEEQELSYESQCSYFEQLIGENEGMTLVGVYGDQGISGLHLENREAMQELLEECRQGKVDLVMTKSISRLSRNAKDFKEIINTFKKYGVRAYFEKEELYSDDPQCEMLMSFLVAVAEEEVRSISENIKLSHDHNNALGRPITCCCYGFRKKERKPGEPHVWEIFEPEAKLVRKAFELKKQKYSNVAIAKVLLKMQEEEPEAKKKQWASSTVGNLLKREAYVGDILTAKTYKADYLDKRSKKNNGEKQQYYIEDHHPAIISRELFDEVQKIMKKNRR